MEIAVVLIAVGIKPECFLRPVTCDLSMNADAAIQIKCTLTVVFKIFKISRPFPCASFLVIISGPVGIVGIEMDARNIDARIVAKQVHTIGRKRNDVVGIPLEEIGINKIGVCHHSAHRIAVAVGYRPQHRGFGYRAIRWRPFSEFIGDQLRRGGYVGKVIRLVVDIIDADGVVVNE